VTDKKLARLVTSATVLIFTLLILFKDSKDSVFNDFFPIDSLRPSPTGMVEGKKDESGIDKVSRVIDGDTIELESGEKVRYIGIDSPEYPKSERLNECFAKEASEKNKSLVLGKKVRLEKDISEMDRYKRLLRYVWVEDENNLEIFVNEYMVKEGYATALTYPPDVKYSQQFKNAEREARQVGRGLWGICLNDENI